MDSPRLRLVLLGASLALAGRTAAQSPAAPPPPLAPEAAPWKAPDRFLGAWLRAAAFLPAPAALSGARAEPAVGIGVGVRPLPFVTVEAEGGWISRDFASPGGAGGRAQLNSRSATVGLRLHRLLLGLEPSAFAGAVFARSVLEVPTGQGTVDAELALSTGFTLGAALDLPLGPSFSLGLDWRWLEMSARFLRLGGGTLDLGGHAVGAVVRLYWP
jgi:hypothetical protein